MLKFFTFLVMASGYFILFMSLLYTFLIQLSIARRACSDNIFNSAKRNSSGEGMKDVLFVYPAALLCYGNLVDNLYISCAGIGIFLMYWVVKNRTTLLITMYENKLIRVFKLDDDT